jgi:UDP-N-acetylmuramoyl-tripeptide--D-alanyl-D-alanine ligase
MYLSKLAEVLRAELKGDDRMISSVNTNTRELMPGQLFIALKGSQFDGHDFLPIACEKKAAGTIVSQALDLPIPTIQVPDTRLALGQIAAYHRSKFNLPIIAVTGSCGKTTTKTMIASILSQVGPTLAPIKSFNNDVGLPLTLLQLDEGHHYAVLEMGANHPNEIAYLSKITRQNIAVITNVAAAHLENFGTLEGVARTKGEIYEALGSKGIAILNADDAFADYWRGIITGRQHITFGIKNKADVVAKNIQLDEKGSATFEVYYPDGKLFIHLPFLGMHNVMNTLAAISATLAVGIPPDAMVKGIAHLSPIAGRLVEHKGLEGAVIIDDTYNANPSSVAAALEVIAKRKGDKIFVLGDMAELGHDGKKFHDDIGKIARKLGINKLYAYGQLSCSAVSAFGTNGFHFDKQTDLINALKSTLHPNTTVLIKGSRLMQMENIVDAMLVTK